MILPAERLLELFRAVKSDKHQSEDKSMFILAANGDVDSVCSASLLESILGKADFTSSLMPVESYQAISEFCEKQQLDDAEELKTVFMINCGATEDIRSVCKLSPSVRVIIIDSHRPIWHGYNNDQDQDTVVVLDADDPVSLQMIPEFIKEEDTLPPEERDADDLSSDDDQDEDDDESSPGRSSQGDGEEHEEGASQRGHADDPGDGSAGGQRKRRAEQTPKRIRKQRRKQQLRQEQLEHRRAVEAYYDKMAGYGMPSSLLLFNLSHSQQEDDNFHVWMAVLGVTDQYVHQRIDPMRYTKWREQLEQHVRRHNNNDTLWGGEPLGDQNGLYNTKATHQLTISAVKDLKVPLLRYWSLYEALQYTHHIATRMQTWREVGEAQLRLFLTELSVPSNQMKAGYMSMHPEVMPHVESKLEATSSKFRIAYEALRYMGFEMRYKNDMRILATDYVHAVTAVLGQPRVDGRSAKAIFTDAVDCLFPQRASGWAQLQRGFDMAKQLAQAVVMEGGLVITRGQVQGGKQAGVWICDLSDISIQNANTLQHPNSLLRLALFLRDARAQRLSTVRPLVLIGPANTSGMCYVVAIRAMQQAGVMQNNPFFVPFQEALRDLGAGEGASMFTFDNAVFLIKKSAVAGFVEELKAIVQAYRAGVEDPRR